MECGPPLCILSFYGKYRSNQLPDPGSVFLLLLLLYVQTYFYLLINQINVFTILQPEQDNAPEKYLKRKIPGSGGLLLLTCLHRLSILWTILLSFQLLLLLCILVSTQIRF